MFHFSTDRLAGLDDMIFKITASPKVPTLIPNHTLDHDAYRIPVRKLRKQKPHCDTRIPLADKTASNNLPPAPYAPTSCMRSYSSGEANLPIPSPPRVSCSPDLPTFRPLPPLPSASALQLPSFLDSSTRSFTSLGDQPPRRSAASLPASALFCVPPVASSRRTAVPKTRNNRVFEGPLWIPAFHHPNSPYVPWSSPARQRILPPPSPVCPSPYVRSGAVAPEPWASSTFSQVQNKSAKERLSSSWKSFNTSIKKGVKTVVSRLRKSKPSLKTLCIGRDMLSVYDDTGAAAAVQPSNAVKSTLAQAHSSGPRDSLASFASSDSTTLAAWLAERRVATSCVIEDAPREMSVGEYELMGSWLDLRHEDGGWVCGIRDCDVHSVGGSPYVASEHPIGLCMAMPFDSADLLSAMRPLPRAPAVAFPAGPFSAPPRCHSLPRLPCQSSDVHSAQETKPVILNDGGRCMSRRRELSMPGGWTFN